MTSQEIFANQDAIAEKWRGQISAVRKDREAAKKAGEPAGHFTRRINEMEQQLSKLLTKGIRS